MAGIAAAVILLFAALGLGLLRRRRARIRSEKLTFLEDVQKVSSDRVRRLACTAHSLMALQVIHTTEFPLWTGPMDTIAESSMVFFSFFVDWGLNFIRMIVFSHLQANTDMYMQVEEGDTGATSARDAAVSQPAEYGSFLFFIY